MIVACHPYLLAAAIFILSLALTTFDCLPFDLRLALRASSMSVVSLGPSSCLAETFWPLDLASISFSNSLA